MTVLLDANVLVALGVDDHVHRTRAEAWFAGQGAGFATCPITQGALIRLVIHGGGTAAVAVETLRRLAASERHTFWADAVGFDEVSLAGVVGHRQVTDAYLAGLARHHGGQLATFDAGLAALHPDVALLVP